MRPPSPKQREDAERLGISSLITGEMSERDVANLLEEASLAKPRDKMAAIRTVARTRGIKALDELLQTGLTVGSKVVFREVVCHVTRINPTHGTLGLRYSDGRRATVASAHSVTIHVV